MTDFWQCFVPLFVAVDAIGVLPLFVAFTEGMNKARRRTVVLQSVTTASLVAVAFLWFGPDLLRFLGISVPDFMVAGGILLLAISLSDLITGEKRQRQADRDSLGAVPIGIPLITGPAVLTTCILLTSMHGRWVTTVAVAVNIAIAGVVFLAAGPITRLLGRTGTKTASKLASLLLAAIAVMLMRKGIIGIVNLHGAEQCRTREILWESDAASGSEVSRKEVELIREFQSKNRWPQPDKQEARQKPENTVASAPNLQPRRAARVRTATAQGGRQSLARAAVRTPKGTGLSGLRQNNPTLFRKSRLLVSSV